MNQKTYYTCKNAFDSMHAYADNALSGPACLLMEAHLRECAQCREELADIRSFEHILRHAWRDPALPSTGLWDQIHSKMMQTYPARQSSGFASLRSWRQIASATVIAVMVTMGATIAVYHTVEDGRLETNLVEAPVQDLKTFVDSQRPFDIATQDAFELRKWFLDKVDFPFPILGNNAALQPIGGRLCYFLNRRIASVSYRVDGRLLSLYIIPEKQAKLKLSTSSRMPGRRALVKEDQEYSQIVWQEDSIVYALVGNLPLTRLIDLSSAFMPPGSSGA